MFAVLADFVFRADFQMLLDRFERNNGGDQHRGSSCFDQFQPWIWFHFPYRPGMYSIVAFAFAFRFLVVTRNCECLMIDLCSTLK